MVNNTSNLSTSYTDNILKFLSPTQLDQLEQKQYSVNFNKGENIFKQGAPMPHIIVIKSGLAKVYLEDGTNRNIILRIIKPGEIIGGPGFFTDYKHHFTVTALEDTVANYIGMDDFKSFLMNNPDFAIELIAYLNKAHISLYDKFKIITHKHMNGRLASTLVYLSDSIYNSLDFETSLTRQDIADMSSMTKESAIRILKDFKTSGIIECTNNHFLINDKQALLSILQNG